MILAAILFLCKLEGQHVYGNIDSWTQCTHVDLKVIKIVFSEKCPLKSYQGPFFFRNQPRQFTQKGSQPSQLPYQVKIQYLQI